MRWDRGIFNGSNGSKWWIFQQGMFDYWRVCLIHSYLQWACTVCDSEGKCLWDHSTEGLTLRDVSAGYAEGSVWASATFSPWIWQWFVHPHCKVLQLILKSCIRKSTKLLSWFMITSITMVYDTYNSSCLLQKNNNAKGHVTCAILCCFEHGQVVAAIKKPFTHFIQFLHTIWLFDIAMV